MPGFPNRKDIEAEAKLAIDIAKNNAAERRKQAVTNSNAIKLAEAQLADLVDKGSRLAEQGKFRIEVGNTSDLLKGVLRKAGFSISAPGHLVSSKDAFRLLLEKFPSMKMAFEALSSHERDQVREMIRESLLDMESEIFSENDEFPSNEDIPARLIAFHEFSETFVDTLDGIYYLEEDTQGYVTKEFSRLLAEARSATTRLQAQLPERDIEFSEGDGIQLTVSWDKAPSSERFPRLPAAVLKWIASDGVQVLGFIQRQITSAARAGKRTLTLEFGLVDGKHWRLRKEGHPIALPSDFRTIEAALQIWEYGTQTAKSKSSATLTVTLVKS